MNHYDLWRQIQTCIEEGGHEHIRITWVPSHCKDHEINGGIISREHFLLNQGADKCADQGADSIWGL